MCSIIKIMADVEAEQITGVDAAAREVAPQKRNALLGRFCLHCREKATWPTPVGLAGGESVGFFARESEALMALGSAGSLVMVTWGLTNAVRHIRDYRAEARLSET